MLEGNNSLDNQKHLGEFIMFFFSEKRFFVKAVCIHKSEPGLNFEAIFKGKFKTRKEACAELEDIRWAERCFPDYKSTFVVEEVKK